MQRVGQELQGVGLTARIDQRPGHLGTRVQPLQPVPGQLGLLSLLQQRPGVLGEPHHQGDVLVGEGPARPVREVEAGDQPSPEGDRDGQTARTGLIGVAGLRQWLPALGDGAELWVAPGLRHRSQLEPGGHQHGGLQPAVVAEHAQGSVLRADDLTGQVEHSCGQVGRRQLVGQLVLAQLP